MDIAGNIHLANSDKARRYYSIFLNTIAGIAQGFDAKIIKNVELRIKNFRTFFILNF